ncbi:hypothetical protein SAICODRAFT_124426 [Saitoella complicata NRRL Y-17804]|uniref:uncharacterized protein n=1 Tax=Saitoella complicata (strain BCRC 22490 / CBS 7301 / JCM 7358 / NBRC 10748 / NRRL Y-17804) TaxID=698492 RepID=UPI000867D014|nr:uncharacterized protein SAICODRAFT_124426 [Saitoella complicata NRRL Y-17804]ODQ53071.1 hypothetical protein SAICODRAFT_124426 [Saitoella complicata NRRL Y-17804]
MASTLVGNSVLSLTGAGVALACWQTVEMRAAAYIPATLGFIASLSLVHEHGSDEEKSSVSINALHSHHSSIVAEVASTVAIANMPATTAVEVAAPASGHAHTDMNIKSRSIPKNAEQSGGRSTRRMSTQSSKHQRRRMPCYYYTNRTENSNIQPHRCTAAFLHKSCQERESRKQ